MKRFISMIVAACAFFAASAQNQLATLSHDGELTAFTGIYSLEDAIKAAVNGDIIYLSEGDFAQKASSDSYLYIRKKITIIGCGYNSKIIPHVYVHADSEDMCTDDTEVVLFDGVRIGSIIFGKNLFEIMVNDYTIRNSFISELGGTTKAGKTLNIERCWITNMQGIDNEMGLNYSAKVYVENSKINQIEAVRRFANSMRNIYVTNTNIKYTDYFPEYVDACIIESVGNYDDLYCTVKRSLLPQDYSDFSSILTYDCYYENSSNGFLDGDLNATFDLLAKEYLGQDHKVIGAYGGSSPFSEYPSVPTIDSEKSSVEFDATTNKLNVTITVASN